MKISRGLKNVFQAAFLIIAIALPAVISSQYIIHILNLIFIWGFMATAWSYMGRFGLVSLGHGAFMGIGAYTSSLLFNTYSLSPWIGMLVAAIAAMAFASILGYACFRSGVIGDYFALVTLAVAEVAALIIVAFREITSGSLGLTLKSAGNSIWYLQFESKVPFYYIFLSFLIIALYVWKRIDKNRMQMALTAIGEDELASASLGVNIIKYKMQIIIISALFTAIGGVLYAQYITYINPHTVSGIEVSLSIPFKAILGGMFTLWGPFVGSAIIVSLEEYIRIAFGPKYGSLSQVVYGIALILMIIYLPNGIFGTFKEKFINKNR